MKKLDIYYVDKPGIKNKNHLSKMKFNWWLTKRLVIMLIAYSKCNRYYIILIFVIKSNYINNYNNNDNI